MSYFNRAVITDVNGKPVPQYYNDKSDQYEPARGTHGGISYVPVVEPLTLLEDVGASTQSSFEVGPFKVVTLEIYGTATSAAVTFKAIGPSGTPRLISGTRVSDGASGTSGAMNEIWRINVSGLQFFQVDVSSITGGLVTIKGTCSSS